MAEEIEDPLEIAHRRLLRIERTLKQFQMATGPGVTAEGSIATGYAVNVTQIQAHAAGGVVVVTGACCIFNDDTDLFECSITTAAACAAAEGIFLGTSTTCDPDPCNYDFNQFPELVCDVISASGRKCGVTRMDGGTLRRYRQINSSGSWDFTVNGVTACGNPCQDVMSLSESQSVGDTLADGSCPARSCSCDVTQTVGSCGDQSYGCCQSPPAGEDIYTPMGQCGSWAAGACGAGTVDCDDSDEAADHQNLVFTSNNVNTTGSGSVSVTYSNEYTTAELISDTIENLPAYDDDFDDTPCSATAGLSDSDQVFDRRDFKYKWVIGSPPPAGATWYWNEHFEPGSIDTPRQFTFNGTETETSVLEVEAPDTTDATITITGGGWTP